MEVIVLGFFMLMAVFCCVGVSTDKQTVSVHDPISREIRTYKAVKKEGSEEVILVEVKK